MKLSWMVIVLCLSLAMLVGSGQAATGQAPARPTAQLAELPDDFRQLLDVPLLFVKRHSYTGIHIYDTFYRWPANGAGGGIYVLENPAAPRAQWKTRAVIDPKTPGTLGGGVYSHPELSWDARKVLFCYQHEPNASTCIFEIGIDGQGLRRLSDPSGTFDSYKGRGGGQHDVAPAYLPDGRIVFLSTRPSGLVPCNNTGVAILHVMNADGSDLHPISVNNVNEFDPAVLPDGRILHGRWEYVDKNALTIQSLWAINPDGTQETSVFANNMVFPEAVLDARPVPNSHLIVGTLAKHNSSPRGSIGFIDPHKGKNNPAAITNLEHPNDPTHDRGDSCEPWPLNKDVVIFSGRPKGQARNLLEMIDRAGRRVPFLADAHICLHSPMLVKPRPTPRVIPDSTDRQAKTGKFFVQDIYKGLTPLAPPYKGGESALYKGGENALSPPYKGGVGGVGVKRGDIKWLRVLEETSRVSPSPGGAQPYNQTFLVSAALAFSVKNYLGIVPVDEDGSCHFEVPAGRAVYFQALDGDHRLVHGMRTFVQAAPGTTRACIGCHEQKSTVPDVRAGYQSLKRPLHRLKPESWGSGYVDYPGMVQPILDKHCVSCHGGSDGIAAGLDLSGGWTEHFSISYENLVNRRQTQLVAYWIAGIDCMNGTAFWSSQIFPPRSHGSGAAPLAELLVKGHHGFIPNLSRTERDLLMAWIDSNGLYHGTWDYTDNGCAIKNWAATKQALTAEMQKAGCLKCHGDGKQAFTFENDWINLQDPHFSRILRAPLASTPPSPPLGKGGIEDGFGLGLCRNRKLTDRRLKLLWSGYAHAVLPLDKFPKVALQPRSTEGKPVVSFTSNADPHYQNVLAIIRKARAQALASPRQDMPGADVSAGACRHFNPPPVPDTPAIFEAKLDDDGVVQLAWERSARTIGLDMELHRGAQANFQPNDKTLLAETGLFRGTDREAPAGQQHYAVVFVSGEERSKPVYASINVPPAPKPPAPSGLKAQPGSHSVRLEWQAPRDSLPGYHVYRQKAGDQAMKKITSQPVRQTSFIDAGLEPKVPFTYLVRAVGPRGGESEPTATVTAAATVIQEPVFTAPLARDANGLLFGNEALPGRTHGGARLSDGVLTLKPAGFVTFPRRDEFDLNQALSVECWVKFDQQGKMPVIISAGLWNQSGWFVQWLGQQWRWHVAGLDCDGGKPALGPWTHLAATFDGKTARLFENGVLVAEKTGTPRPNPWSGDLFIGQYSGQPGPEFQVHGAITGVRIYHRPLTAEEAAAGARERPK